MPKSWLSAVEVEDVLEGYFKLRGTRTLSRSFTVISKNELRPLPWPYKL